MQNQFLFRMVALLLVIAVLVICILPLVDLPLTDLRAKYSILLFFGLLAAVTNFLLTPNSLLQELSHSFPLKADPGNVIDLTCIRLC